MTACGVTYCNNKATHTWSGHPTCDGCGTPKKAIPVVGITGNDGQSFVQVEEPEHTTQELYLMMKVEQLEKALAKDLNFEELPGSLKRDPARDAFIMNQANALKTERAKNAELLEVNRELQKKFRRKATDYRTMKGRWESSFAANVTSKRIEDNLSKTIRLLEEQNKVERQGNRDLIMMELQENLTDAFVNYQWRLENPMPSVDETQALKDGRYMNDPTFHARVTCLTAGVLEIVQKWLKGN